MGGEGKEGEGREGKGWSGLVWLVLGRRCEGVPRYVRCMYVSWFNRMDGCMDERMEGCKFSLSDYENGPNEKSLRIWRWIWIFSLGTNSVVTCNSGVGE